MKKRIPISIAVICWALLKNVSLFSQTTIIIDACDAMIDGFGVASWPEPNGYCHLQNKDAIPRANHVTLNFEVPPGQAGNYSVTIQYAARDSRPVDIHFDGFLVFSNVLTETTLTWNVSESSLSRFVGSRYLTAGRHTVKVSRLAPIPHISKVILTKW